MDLPEDYKIEHDRLVYEIKPIAKKLFELIKTLPNPALGEIIDYGDFVLSIDDKPSIPIKENLEMALDCLIDKENDQAQNQAYRHIDSALSKLKGPKSVNQIQREFLAKPNKE